MRTPLRTAVSLQRATNLPVPAAAVTIASISELGKLGARFSFVSGLITFNQVTSLSDMAGLFRYSVYI